MATKDDAALLVQILQWASQSGMDDSLFAIYDEGFDASGASIRDRNVRNVLNFGETVGTLVKQHLLDADLVHDLWAIEPTWNKVSAAALAVREKSGEPRMYENFEALARQRVAV